MRDIRALFTAEYLHSRVFKGIEEQTMNSEVKIIEKKIEPNREKRKSKNQHLIQYFTFDW